MSYVFRMKGDLEHPALDELWQLGAQGVRQEGDEVLVYFAAKLDLIHEGSWQEIDDQGYIEAYYASLQPVVLEHLVIAPTHSEVGLKVGQKVLWLDPGMAFGTGHHETTKMVLAGLEQLELAGKTVLDVGAGSGILAIAADLLGAARVLGVDIDPLTIPVAEENARLNRSRAQFEEGTLDSVMLKPEVIVANLFAELHIRLAEAYCQCLKPHGDLLLSGIMREKEAMVMEALSPYFVHLRIRHDGEWSFIAAQKA